MQHRNAPPVAFRLALLGALLVPGIASAGAWTKPKGEGEVIVTGLYSEALEAFADDGGSYEIPVFHKAEVSAYAEFGLTDWATAIGRTELQSFSTDEPLSMDEARFGLSGFGGRLRLWQGDGAVVSAEASGFFASRRDDRTDNEPDGEIDLRLLAGYGFALRDWPAFLDVQGAYRFRIGGVADEVRADVTLGLRPHARLLLMAQSFNRLSTGDGTDEHKAEISAVYDLTESLSLQVGGLATIAGSDALRERGVVTAIWYRF